MYYSRALLYCPGCVVHPNTIGWNPDKQQQLEEVLLSVYKETGEMNYGVTSIEKVLYLHENSLPHLGGNLSWTSDLLATLCSQGNMFIILGSARRAYTLARNQSRREGLGGFVARVVRERFKGGCGRSQLDEWMVSHGVVLKRLTPTMFLAPSGLVMTEYECLWEGI